MGADLDRAGARAGGYADLKTVGRAMQILEALAERPMRARELAEVLDLKWATAYRSLTYLVEHEYLSRDAVSGQYSIGPHMYRLGITYLVDHRLVRVAQPLLRDVVDELRCSAQLNERQDLEVITLTGVEGNSPIDKTSPGFRFPLGIAAKGRVLLAYAPQDVRERVLSQPLPALTARSVTDPEEMRAELDRVVSTGHAITRDDLQLGVGSVAAPVRDADGNVVACVSLIVRAARLADETYLEQLTTAASTIAGGVASAAGWRPGMPRRDGSI
jgi:DNA-binding IclR family transcriptional regulator